MNKKSKNVLKNIYYTIYANLITLIVSTCLTIFVPKMLGVVEYSYWQLYIFYISYAGFFHFGLIDGIYLQTGGKEYEELDKNDLGSQFWVLLLVEVVLATILSLYCFFNISSYEKNIVLILSCISGVIIIAKSYLMYIYQATNKIKEYSSLTRGDRYLYFICAMIYLFLGGRNFVWLVIFDILSRLFLLCLAILRSRDLLFGTWPKKSLIIKSMFKNISIGSKLMLGNIAGQLILGVIRYGIEKNWDIETFGMLSFTLSISNMVLTFINAVSIVMFPLLRKSPKEFLPVLYQILRNIFVPLSFVLLLMYSPIKLILSIWLPNYSESLLYMGILFPIFIYEGRMSLLTNTYLKSIREERNILYVNILSLILSIVSSYITIFILGNLISTVFLMIIILIVRCVLAEKILSRKLNINLDKDLCFEVFLTMVFSISNFYLNNMQAFCLYSFCLIVYLLFKRNGLIWAITKMKELLSEKNV